MTRAAYIPQPGTICFRAVEYLKRQGDGAEVSSAEMAEELGIDQQVSPYLLSAVKYGLIVKRKDGLVLRWSLGKGPVAVDPDDEDDAPPKQIVVPAALAKPLTPKTKKPDPMSIPSMVASYVKAIGTDDPTSPVEKINTPSPGMRVALWSDGTLEVRRDACDLVLFTRDEARAIVDYLNAIDLAVLEVEA